MRERGDDRRRPGSISTDRAFSRLLRRDGDRLRGVRAARDGGRARGAFARPAGRRSRCSPRSRAVRSWRSSPLRCVSVATARARFVEHVRMFPPRLAPGRGAITGVERGRRARSRRARAVRAVNRALSPHDRRGRRVPASRSRATSPPRRSRARRRPRADSSVVPSTNNSPVVDRGSRRGRTRRRSGRWRGARPCGGYTRRTSRATCTASAAGRGTRCSSRRTSAEDVRVRARPRTSSCVSVSRRSIRRARPAGTSNTSSPLPRIRPRRRPAHLPPPSPLPSRRSGPETSVPGVPALRPAGAARLVRDRLLGRGGDAASAVFQLVLRRAPPELAALPGPPPGDPRRPRPVEQPRPAPPLARALSVRAAERRVPRRGVGGGGRDVQAQKNFHAQGAAAPRADDAPPASHRADARAGGGPRRRRTRAAIRRFLRRTFARLRRAFAFLGGRKRRARIRKRRRRRAKKPPADGSRDAPRDDDGRGVPRPRRRASQRAREGGRPP